MSDTMQPTSPGPDFQNDGSLRDAIVAMDDLDGFDDPSPNGREPVREEKPRNPRGQFARNGQDDPRRQPAPTGKQASADLMAAPEDDQAEAEEQSHPVDEESFFELPGEKEGDKPTRVKAEEVWQGYQELQQVKQELEETRRQMAPPEAYDNAISQSIQARGQLLRQMNHYRALISPREPDAMMLNPKSENYDPNGYYQQLQLSAQMKNQIASVEAELEQLTAAQQREEKLVDQARAQRASAAVMQLWPELRDEKVAAQVRDDLAKYYRVDQQVLNGIRDPRFFALAKDALAYRQGLRSKETAVRVVKSKPKLVRGQARETNGAKNQQFAQNMRRLSSDGSIESAAALMGDLL